MSDPVTTNLSLTKPTVGADENSWGDLLNGNFDALDALWSGIGAAAFGTAATRDVGTSGAVVPLLDGANTFSGANAFPLGTGIDANGRFTVNNLQNNNTSVLNPANGMVTFENPSGNVMQLYYSGGSAGVAALSVGVQATNGELAAFNYQGANVGNITTNGSSTSYSTVSDETFKDFIGPYDPGKAIAIIRADPVRDFHWNARSASPGGYAVGWGAQSSHAVSPDLATPGGWFIPPQAERRAGDGKVIAPFVDGRAAEASEPGAVYAPWAVDQSKRTPYLWAAVSWLLDERDQLKAEMAALQAAMTGLQAQGEGGGGGS